MNKKTYFLDADKKELYPSKESLQANKGAAFKLYDFSAYSSKYTIVAGSLNPLKFIKAHATLANILGVKQHNKPVESLKVNAKLDIKQRPDRLPGEGVVNQRSLVDEILQGLKE